MRVERVKGESLETAMPAWWVVLRGGGGRGCGGGSWRGKGEVDCSLLGSVPVMSSCLLGCA